MPFALNKRFRKSISLRIAFLFCVTFAVGLMFAFLVTYFEIRYSLEKSAREILSAKLQETKAILTTEGVAGLKDFLAEENNRILNAPYLVRVFTFHGETIYIKPSIQEKMFDFDKAFSQSINPSEYLGWRSLQAIDDEDKFNLLTEQADSKFYIQVGKSSEEREGLLEEILLDFAIMEVILVFLSAFFGIWYARKSLAPLRGLLATIHLIEKGNLSQRMPSENSEDELQEIRAAFNRMIDRIEKLIQVMRESLDNVAHDIRTPLTRIRAVAEQALISNDSTLLRESLEETAESTIHIAEIVDQLLSISEAEAGTLAVRYQLCSVRLLLNDVIDIYEFTAAEKSIEVICESVSSNLFWELDQKRIKQAVANLIDNAIKFSPSHTQIKVLAFEIQSGLKISVVDQGSGISDLEKQRIWDRLYRGDKSRSTKGLGLGLSIVRAIVLAHGGVCEVTSLPQGSEISMIIPKKIT